MEWQKCEKPENKRQMYSSQSTQASSHSECVWPTVNHDLFLVLFASILVIHTATDVILGLVEEREKGMTRLVFHINRIQKCKSVKQKCLITMETNILSRAVHVKFFLTPSLLREANLTKTRKLSNPDLSDKT